MKAKKHKKFIRLRASRCILVPAELAEELGWNWSTIFTLKVEDGKLVAEECSPNAGKKAK